jgi:sugar transferase (PEP-CTERM/EpsH1 system associated)
VKILALCPRVPFPADSGDRIRSYQLLLRLSEKHELHLACPDSGVLDQHRKAELESIAERVFVRRMSPFRRSVHAARSLLAHRPTSLGWFHESRVEATLRRWSADTDYDVALVSRAKMAPYWLRQNRRSGLPAVLDFVDVASEDFGARAAYSRVPRRWVYQRERWLLAKYEDQIARRAGGVVVVSEAEAELLRERVSVPVEVIENGVDGGAFARPEVSAAPDPGRVVFVGRLDTEANVDAVRWYVNHVHPRIRAHCERTFFDAVGAHPVRDLRAMRERPDIRVTGWVKDVRPYLWQSTVAVAPLRIPPGTTNGVLEAMAASVPVVATPAAARGLARPTGDHITVAETPTEFAVAVCRFLEDPSRGRAQCAAALEYVDRYHSWDRAAEKLEARIEAVVRGAAT